MPKQNDADLKPGEWSFETKEIAQSFDNYVRRQLPWYDLATGIVSHFARGYLATGSLMVDIGASTGNIGRACSDLVEQRKARFVAYEPSETMVAAYEGIGEIRQASAADAEYEDASVVTWFLTAQFMTPSERQRELRRCLADMRSGGALIVFDRFVGVGGYAGQLSSRLAMAGKYEAGATPDEIIQKELSLVGVQRPLREEELPETPVPIFRCGDFAGFVIEAP